MNVNIKAGLIVAAVFGGTAAAVKWPVLALIFLTIFLTGMMFLVVRAALEDEIDL